jgi:hypothetical protein
MQSERPQSQVPPSVESTKALARPKRACNSQYFVHDVSRGLYLLKSEAKDIEECRQLGDGVVVFFKRLLWVQFKRFKVISSAELLLSQESFLSRDQEHAQILHDVQRGHWVLAYRCAGGVFVLDPLWVADRSALSTNTERQLERLFEGCSDYTVLPCVQQEGEIMCGYFCLAMLFALNNGMSFPDVGQLLLDQACLDIWLMHCASTKTMSMPQLLKPGGSIAKSRIISPEQPLRVIPICFV